MSFFAIEENTSKMSKAFNGSSNGQDTLLKPGLIRMSIESIFALIFSNKTN
jgi:hypothetical protein